MEGEIVKANGLLGRRFSISGTVIAGDGRGKTLGFPTANIAVSDPRKILPGNGVYAVKVIVESALHDGLMSVGVLPTFYEHHAQVCEVFIYDFNEDLYGRTVTVDCVQRIRGEKKFSSSEELITEMNNDKRTGKNILENV